MSGYKMRFTWKAWDTLVEWNVVLCSIMQHTQQDELPVALALMQQALNEVRKWQKLYSNMSLDFWFLRVIYELVSLQTKVRQTG